MLYRNRFVVVGLLSLAALSGCAGKKDIFY